MPARTQKPREIRVAIDTGGTFTDCVWLERGQLRMRKVFSTPDDPARAILDALKPILGTGRSLVLLHGTTVGTNALLQRTGARVALVTTAGFEDVIEIGRQTRPKLYDFFFDRVEPLIPRALRFGIAERIGGGGEIVQALAGSEIKVLAARLLRKKPEAIAICLLFSFANPRHERSLARALGKLGLPISVSHEILPEFREYERTSTVVVNAYLQPVMQRYLQELDRRLQKANQRRCRTFVMQSSGGIAPLQFAAREPVRTVLSGPAGGVVGAAIMARRSGFDPIISFDMGGTSTDVALVDRAMHASSQAEIAGLPIGVPMLDIHTVGAGGGSIARFDVAGALRVGPESVGADPGPICYGRGTQPTVTDANLILGRLQPHSFLGGEFALDLEHTRRVMGEWLKLQQKQKERSKLTLEAFAAGIVQVINATMEKAIRVVSIERGRDPRDFTLVAFGGAGGLHACELAAALSIPRVIVPARPGALSAVGILLSDVVKDYSRSVMLPMHGKSAPARRDSQRIDREFALLQANAQRDFGEEAWQGRVHYRRTVDVRYRGQGFELNIPYTRKLVEDFQREHQRQYGHSYPERDLELVTLRLRAVIKSPQKIHDLGPPSKGTLSTRQPRGARVKLFFAGKALAARAHSREALQTGKKYSGPAVVTEYSATTIVPPGWLCQLDSAGNLILVADKIHR